MRVTGMRRAMVLLAVVLLSLLAFNAAAAQTGMPGGITEEAVKIHDLWVFTLILAAVVFVFVETVIIVAVIKFRKKSDELPPQTHGSTVVEIIWTTIPVLIVIGLFAYSFIVLREIENEENSADLTVNVEGFQFQWEGVYNLNDLGSVNDPNAKGQVVVTGTQANEPTFWIPVGEPVEFRLKSQDVIHSFYVRDFLYKLDLVPGRDNRFTVTPTQTGTFTGQCAELCGVDHALMRFSIRVVERAEFDQWIAEQSAGQRAAAQQPR